ncbi:MAG: hypothetical protein IJR26_09910 [Bacteroidales bacterium]|nr:hypothetical protein [Bacteroidales bacterium]
MKKRGIYYPAFFFIGGRASQPDQNVCRRSGYPARPKRQYTISIGEAWKLRLLRFPSLRGIHVGGRASQPDQNDDLLYAMAKLGSFASYFFHRSVAFL